jgi:hypothetical protein
MMSMNKKLVLVDCDGVLVDWLYTFNNWMKEHGYSTIAEVNSYDLEETYGLPREEMKALIKTFNESAAICCIPPLRDAVKYVRKMHEELGCVFHCITSLSLNPFAAKLRKDNIENLFGKTAFEKIVCLDTGADKDDALLPYLDSGCLWVEDKTQNAELGLRLGLTSILMEHSFTEDYEHEDIIKVKNWKEIYEMML